MERKSRIIFWAFVIIMIGCDKDNTPTPIAQGNCLLAQEVLNNSEETLKFEYDEQGNPSFVRRFDRYGTESETYTTYSNQIRHDYEVSSSPVVVTIEYWNADIFTRLPALAYMSLTQGGETKVHYQTFIFSYDDKGRLKKVSQQTENIPNDFEYDLDIHYDDNDNVTVLQYEVTTGPHELTGISVERYDDKPSPFTGVKGYLFLMINYSWNNSDPGPIIAALSKNNPLDYTLGEGATKWEREMVYKYNEEGYPIERKSTNRHENGEHTFIDTFSYTCK